MLQPRCFIEKPTLSACSKEQYTHIMHTHLSDKLPLKHFFFQSRSTKLVSQRFLKYFLSKFNFTNIFRSRKHEVRYAWDVCKNSYTRSYRVSFTTVPILTQILICKRLFASPNIEVHEIRLIASQVLTCEFLFSCNNLRTNKTKLQPSCSNLVKDVPRTLPSFCRVRVSYYSRNQQILSP